MQDYHSIDQRLHLYCQLIAKANRTFVPKEEDDSHTNLYFDPVGQRIVGHWIDLNAGKSLLSFHLRSNSYEWLDSSLRIVQRYAIAGKTLQEVEQELEAGLSGLGLNPDGFSEPLHFEIPAYSFAQEQLQPLPLTEVQLWMDFRQLANNACLALLGYAQMNSAIRIWPHHFDTGIYGQADEKIGIGFGWAMQDDMVGAPYFYLTGYPTTGKIDYESLPKLTAGTWKTATEWKGAVLSMEQLFEISPVEQNRVVSTFIRQGLDYYLSSEVIV